MKEERKIKGIKSLKEKPLPEGRKSYCRKCNQPFIAKGRGNLNEFCPKCIGR